MNPLSPRPLIVNLARRFGGAEVRVLHLVDQLGPKRCQVACLSNSPLAERLRNAGFAPLEISSRKLDTRIAARLAAIIQEGQYTVVDAHNVQSYAWVSLAARSLNPRPALIATIHSSTRLEQKNPLKGAAYESLTRLSVAQFDRVITVSQCLCQELQKYLPAERIARVPNGIMTRRAAPGTTIQIRHELGIADSSPLIGTLGRLENAKGIDILLWALKKLLADWPNLHCVLIGEGRMEAQLKQFAIKHQLEKNVHFAGFRNESAHLLEALDIFVLPSRTEGIPFALLEACAAARPVVASRVGGVPEVINDGQTGLLVEPENADQLAKAIDSLLGMPLLAQAMGRRAAQDVAIRFGMEQMVAGTLDAYTQAMQTARSSQ